MKRSRNGSAKGYRWTSWRDCDSGLGFSGRYNSDQSSISSIPDTCYEEKFTQRKIRKDDNLNHLYGLLTDFNIPRYTINELVEEGYNSIANLLNMPNDVAEVVLGYKSRHILDACVTYVQLYNVRFEDLDRVIDEQWKFQLFMGGSQWSTLLNGGFRCREFIVLAGESALGKTLLMTTLALRAAAVGVTVYYLDADDKMVADRVNELCEKLKFKKEILKDIKRARACNPGELLATIRNVKKNISGSVAGSRYLVIVDSLTEIVRKGIPGYANIDKRQEMIAKYTDCLKKMASDDERDVIVAVTAGVAMSQASSNSTVDGLIGLGGCVLQHCTTTRLFLSLSDVNGVKQKVLTLQYSLRAPERRFTYRIVTALQDPVAFAPTIMDLTVTAHVEKLFMGTPKLYLADLKNNFIMMGC